MKNILLSIALLFGMLLQAQIKDEITLDNGRKFLIGQISIDDLKKAPYQSWFDQNFTNYQVEGKSIQSFSGKLKEYNLLLFMGTWCGDSKREVPRIVRVLEEADFPMEQLKIVAVDRRKGYYKKSPGGEEWGLDIKRVPTLLFLKDGKEVNRLVESPRHNLEQDFLAIIGGEQYTPNYAQKTK